MTVEELIKQLEQMPANARVRVSLDVSVGDNDFDRRAYGETYEGLQIESEGEEITLLFVGELNYEI